MNLMNGKGSVAWEWAWWYSRRADGQRRVNAPVRGKKKTKRKAWSAKVDAINVREGRETGEEAGRREERQIHTYSIQVLQPRGIKVNTACSARLQNHIGMYR